jgi:undecaprenyl diphosphate synthase
LEGGFPEHIAIIMDGNGRWARRRKLPRVMGHRQGIDSVREITTECARMGVKSLTLYAFSVENWSRPAEETGTLMSLLERFMVKERKTLEDNAVRLRCIGRLDDLPAAALAELRRTEELTANNTGLVLRLALSYGSRAELGDACRALALDVAAGKLTADEIGDETLRQYLYDPDTPDPDLLIRTAGEMRLSNFLLWQISYSELFVTEKCWPDFRRSELLEALRQYAGRQRRFGGLVPETSGEPDLVADGDREQRASG